MKQTLLVNYTPRAASNTRKLTDFFLQQCRQKTEFEVLDLAKTPPDLLLEDNLNLVLKRNLAGQTLSQEELTRIEKNDNMAQQVLEADFIVLSHPMFNLSLPATVKAWVDAILQPGKTFQLAQDGYRGLCFNKKAMVLMTTGTDHAKSIAGPSDFATGLLKSCFGIIGIPSVHISAQGLNQYPDRVDSILEKAKQEIKTVCQEWYR